MIGGVVLAPAPPNVAWLCLLPVLGLAADLILAPGFGFATSLRLTLDVAGLCFLARRCACRVRERVLSLSLSIDPDSIVGAAAMRTGHVAARSDSER